MFFLPALSLGVYLIAAYRTSLTVIMTDFKAECALYALGLDMAVLFTFVTISTLIYAVSFPSFSFPIMHIRLIALRKTN